jgi:hypothetical protein
LHITSVNIFSVARFKVSVEAFVTKLKLNIHPLVVPFLRY